MKEFATHHAILERKQKDPTVLIVGAHHDDEKMLNLETHLAHAGAGVTRVTLTNSDARDLPSYPQEKLPAIRWQEGLASGLITGVTDVHRIDIPDGHLEEYTDYAVEFGSEFTEKKVAILAPNEQDKHPDHRAAYEVALKLGGSSIAVYGMDTLNGFSSNGDFLVPDFYVPLSWGEARNEKRSYRAHTSQTSNLPVGQRRAKFDVLGMTRRRGKEIGMPHAAVVFQANNTTDNPLGEMIELYRAA